MLEFQTVKLSKRREKCLGGFQLKCLPSFWVENAPNINLWKRLNLKTPRKWTIRETISTLLVMSHRFHMKSELTKDLWLENQKNISVCLAKTCSLLAPARRTRHHSINFWTLSTKTLSCWTWEVKEQELTRNSTSSTWLGQFHSPTDGLTDIIISVPFKDSKTWIIKSLLFSWTMRGKEQQLQRLWQKKGLETFTCWLAVSNSFTSITQILLKVQTSQTTKNTSGSCKLQSWVQTNNKNNEFMSL